MNWLDEIHKSKWSRENKGDGAWEFEVTDSNDYTLVFSEVLD